MARIAILWLQLTWAIVERLNSPIFSRRVVVVLLSVRPSGRKRLEFTLTKLLMHWLEFIIERTLRVRSSWALQ